MRKLLKHKVILLAFSIIFSTYSYAEDIIVPLPKPTVDVEAKIKTAEKKVIYPRKKPTLKKEQKQIDEIKEIVDTAEKSEKSIFIYPAKKPIIVKKKIHLVRTYGKSIGLELKKTNQRLQIYMDRHCQVRQKQRKMIKRTLWLKRSRLL